MKTKAPEFLDLLEPFFDDYMPNSAGLSPNTIKSYFRAFRLLMAYLYEKKNTNAVDVKFANLDFDTVNGFLCWIEQERHCGIATRNQRLTALSSFAQYAQNRSMEAAVFANVVRKIPVKTPAAKPRTRNFCRKKTRQKRHNETR